MITDFSLKDYFSTFNHNKECKQKAKEIHALVDSFFISHQNISEIKKKIIGKLSDLEKIKPVSNSFNINIEKLASRILFSVTALDKEELIIDLLTDPEMGNIQEELFLWLALDLSDCDLNERDERIK